jgi:hypothetical protein
VLCVLVCGSCDSRIQYSCDDVLIRIMCSNVSESAEGKMGASRYAPSLKSLTPLKSPLPQHSKGHIHRGPRRVLSGFSKRR